MNIPNILTIFRFFLIPIFITIFYSPIDNNIKYAIYIFILAGITDVLDGYIARNFNMVTKWGTVLDPLADKLMQLTVLVCFTDKNFLPIWVILVIGIKEILMIIGALFLYYFADKTVVPANKFGKLATVFFYAAILVIAFTSNITIKYVFVGLTLLLTIIAFVNYLIGFNKISKVTNIVDK
ncbi:CDP-alcohol phosphatidyltransferase family protein [Thermohalobacter berrensis]|uniref:CDP-diacylglycerol--glycerol-3-phosphate 3-phosphatidyltransferase n=1 Tax=Thermohalobacter berrensis TaxID=99594 RepID=A0A419T316_9FIRM|nr:CDP-alcohol phosphatidyltransferase family protein [Thermohalobacter berrensis]RKD31798.1 CDP-diacylglycerol--glycerol-3-phosphate 3-phosphatidyltransferase [Thermohalobacter berrensis]